MLVALIALVHLLPIGVAWFLVLLYAVMLLVSLLVNLLLLVLRLLAVLLALLVDWNAWLVVLHLWSLCVSPVLSVVRLLVV